MSRIKHRNSERKAHERENIKYLSFISFCSECILMEIRYLAYVNSLFFFLYLKRVPNIMWGSVKLLHTFHFNSYREGKHGYRKGESEGETSEATISFEKAERNPLFEECCMCRRQGEASLRAQHFRPEAASNHNLLAIHCCTSLTYV